MMPQVLYFDLGNVLFSFSHAQMYRQMAEVAGVSPETLEHVLVDDPSAAGALVAYETGRATTDEFFDVFTRAIGKRPDAERFAHAVSDIFSPIDATLDFVRKLAGAGHRLAILSNTNPIHWSFVTDGRFPLVADIGRPGGAFGWAVLSYEAGAMKPGSAIFATAIERAGIAASEIFFVDDIAENVAGARAAGIDAVQYENTMKLIDDLRLRGISV
jgi:putative hydrolase of the HAD superfamily